MWPFLDTACVQPTLLELPSQQDSELSFVNGLDELTGSLKIWTVHISSPCLCDDFHVGYQLNELSVGEALACWSFVGL